MATKQKGLFLLGFSLMLKQRVALLTEVRFLQPQPNFFSPRVCVPERDTLKTEVSRLRSTLGLFLFKEEIMLKIIVKCVGCGVKKEVGQEQREQPMCEKCFMPMLAEKATIKE